MPTAIRQGFLLAHQLVPSVRSRFRQRMSGRIKDNQRFGARGGHLTFEDSWDSWNMLHFQHSTEIQQGIANQTAR